MHLPDSSLIIPTVLPDQWQWFWEHNKLLLSDVRVIVVASFPRPTGLSGVVQWLELEKPMGFAKTVNHGFAAASTTYVGTCNDDVQLSQGWEKIVEVCKTHAADGVNPVIEDSGGGVETAGITILPIGRSETITKVVQTQPYPTQALNGACVMFTQRFLKATGGFDESFGSYLEDVELSIRGRKLGFQLFVDPGIRVMHYGHRTTNSILGNRKKAWLDMSNWWRIILRHTTMRQWLEHGGGILLERARNVNGYLKACFK